jgi:hypothetical protein
MRCSAELLTVRWLVQSPPALCLLVYWFRQVASQLFDEIMVAPHLDDGLKRGKWRNMLHFDPLWKVRGPPA